MHVWASSLDYFVHLSGSEKSPLALKREKIRGSISFFMETTIPGIHGIMLLSETFGKESKERNCAQQTVLFTSIVGWISFVILNGKFRGNFFALLHFALFCTKLWVKLTTV
jgi:hypothetical protein